MDTELVRNVVDNPDLCALFRYLNIPQKLTKAQFKQ